MPAEQPVSKEVQTLTRISEPLRSMATRLAHAQAAITADFPAEAENIAAVRAQLASITLEVYDVLGIKVPVLKPDNLN